jgi:4-amino-4-deoxy-L-arabinose transferase-like glycosyltransferase
VSESLNPTVPDAGSLTWRARLAWTALIVSTLYACYFSHLGIVGLVGPDEPRYAWIARSMAESGDWVTPRLYGKAWFEKPPLYYWGAALSFEFFGVSESSARLPSAVAALLGALSLAWLASRLYGARTARWLLLFLPTTVGMIGFSHAAATDMPFSGMLTIAMVAAAALLGLGRAAEEGGAEGVGQRRWGVTIAQLVFGLALGLAVLAKGPVAVILCGGAVLLRSVTTKRWRHSVRLLHPVAVFTFLTVAAPWYVICQRRNPDFFQIFIVEHNFERYLTPQFQHIQPVWFYVPVVAVAFLPWIPLLGWSTWQGIAKLKQTKRISDDSAFLLAWALFCLVFFSISRSKLPGYILPALPPLVLLTTRCYIAEPRRLKAFQLIHLLTALLLAMLFAALELTAPYTLRKGIEFGVAVGGIVAAISLANLILGAAASRKNPDGNFQAGNPSPAREFVAALSVVPILLVLLFSSRLTPSLFEGDPSGKSIAIELQALKIPSQQLYVAGLKRGEHYCLNFYLHQEVPDWDRLNPSAGYVVARSKSCAALAPAGWECEEIPFETQARNRSIYRIGTAGLLAGSSGGGKPK